MPVGFPKISNRGKRPGKQTGNFPLLSERKRTHARKANPRCQHRCTGLLLRNQSQLEAKADDLAQLNYREIEELKARLPPRK